MTNFIVFFVFWKVFVHYLYWKFWIKISLVWCILTFIVADCWIVWVYVQANNFCITLIRWQMTTTVIFKQVLLHHRNFDVEHAPFRLSFHLIWGQGYSESSIYIQLHFCHLLRGASIPWATADHRLSVGWCYFLHQLD